MVTGIVPAAIFCVILHYRETKTAVRSRLMAEMENLKKEEYTRAGHGSKPLRSSGFFLVMLAGIMVFILAAMKPVYFYAGTGGSGSGEAFRFVALGNSVTHHPVCEFWFYECGMAASRPSRDYVHQTVKGIRRNHGKAYSSYSFELVDSPLWELSAAYRKSIKKQLKKTLKKKAQLLVIQYGDNVRNASFFEAALTDLVQYIQKLSPDTRIMILGNLELKDSVNRKTEEIKKKVALSCGVGFVDLSPIAGKKEYQIGYTRIQDRRGRWHQIKYDAVAVHPNDKGMAWIAEKIVNAYEEILTAGASSQENTVQEEVSKQETSQQEETPDSAPASLQGLIFENGGWYFYRYGKPVHSRWMTLSSGNRKDRYYFGKDGRALCGDDQNAMMIKIGKDGYAFDHKGRMLTGVRLIRGKLYWFSKKGRYDKKISARLQKMSKYHRNAKKLTDLLKKYGCRLRKKEFFGKGCLADNEDGMYTFDHFKISVYKYESGRIVVLDVLPL